MKRRKIMVLMIGLAFASSITFLYAQGPGAGYRWTAEPCPYGYAQPNPQAAGPGQGAGYARAGEPCPYGNQPRMGQGRGAGHGRIGEPCPYGYEQPNPNAGGWWTRVQPTTPEQQAFVDAVTDLHTQIREKRFEASNLRAANGDPNRIAALDAEVEQLRNTLHETMYNNRELRQQLGPAGPRGGRGAGMRQGAGPGQAQGAGAMRGRRMGGGFGARQAAPIQRPLAPGAYSPWR